MATQNDEIVQENDSTKVVSPDVEKAETDAEIQRANDKKKFDEDWETRIEIYRQKYGKDPDPDTDLEGLDHIITDEEVEKYRNSYNEFGSNWSKSVVPSLADIASMKQARRALQDKLADVNKKINDQVMEQATEQGGRLTKDGIESFASIADRKKKARE